jgi:voltage-gated potassium channel
LTKPRNKGRVDASVQETSSLYPPSPLSSTLKRTMLGIASVLGAGTAGYHFLEGWSLLDSFYMTVITITTIGFKEVHEMGPRGMIFTLCLIFVGFGVATYSAFTVGGMLIEGELNKILSRRRYMKSIGRLKDHFIICGFGRMGSLICQELHDRGIPLVVVENDPERQDKAGEHGFLLAPGDATDEQVLLHAGVERARGFVSVLKTEAANVYAVLTARELNPGLEIIARAGEESSHKKLLRAGATRVINPYRIGGMRLVMGILKPAVMSFIEVAMDNKKMNIDIEEIRVCAESMYTGKRLLDTGIRKDMDLIIIAVKKKDGQMVFNPGPYTVIEGDDTLIAMGERTSLALLEKKSGEPA